MKMRLMYMEPTSQGKKGDEVHYVKELYRLQPPKFDGSFGAEAADGCFIMFIPNSGFSMPPSICGLDLRL